MPQKVNNYLVVDYGDVQASYNLTDRTCEQTIYDIDTNTTSVFSRTLDQYSGEYIDHYTKTDNASGLELESYVTNSNQFLTRLDDGSLLLTGSDFTETEYFDGSWTYAHSDGSSISMAADGMCTYDNPGEAATTYYTLGTDGLLAQIVAVYYDTNTTDVYDIATGTIESVSTDSFDFASLLQPANSSDCGGVNYGSLLLGDVPTTTSAFGDVGDAWSYSLQTLIDTPEVIPPVTETWDYWYTSSIVIDSFVYSFPIPPPTPPSIGSTTTYFTQVEVATYVPPPTPPRCFAGSTPVLMADGSTKPIEEILAGDAVLAFDGLGNLTPARVSRTYAYDPAEVMELFVEKSDVPIVATPLHRFLTADGVYKPLVKLAGGDLLVGADGRALRLARVGGVAGAAPIFNFTVEGLHTYVAGGVRVHNQKPIGIDLDGDNQIELIGLDESGVFFDTDEDGFKENTAWVGGNDGILAWDSDGDGSISQASEFVFARYGAPGATDLEGLRAAFDTNGDLVLDANDADFARFGVWRDANQNGISEAGEFVSLAQLGITSISLVSDGVQREENGNLILGQTSFTRADGSTGLAADLDLAQIDAGFAETRRTPYRSELIDENGVKAVAVVEGAPVRSLFVGLGGTTIGFGSSGNDWLTGIGSADVTLLGGAGDDTIVGGAGDDVLRGGLGADKISGGGGNDVLYIDAADLARGISGGSGSDLVRVAGLDAVLLDLGAAGVEAAVGNAGNDHFFTSAAEGIEVSGGAGNDLLEGGAGNDVLVGGDGVDRLLGGAGDDTLMIDAEDAQADIDAGSGIDTVVLEDQAGISFDLGAAHAEYALGGSAADRLFTSGSAAVSISGGGGDDTISGGAGDDTLTGGEGDDFIEGGAGNDTIGGGIGNDHLLGGTGNDILMGEADQDRLEGGEGDDILSGDDKDTPTGEQGDDYLNDSNCFAHHGTICLTKKPCSAITIKHYLLVGASREVDDLQWRQAA
ncbi:MAG: hypothetical protein ACOY8P_02925 [Thermodesulfobacteriota bacterium]